MTDESAFIAYVWEASEKNCFGKLKKNNNKHTQSNCLQEMMQFLDQPS